MALKRDPTFLAACDAAINGDPVPFIQYLGLEDLAADIISAAQDGSPAEQVADARTRLVEMALIGIAIALRDEASPMTLKDALYADFPEFDLTDQIDGSNTSGDDWPIVSDEDIEQMEDCTFETIESVLGYMFSETIPEMALSIDIRRLDAMQYDQRPRIEEDVQYVARSFILPILRKCAEVGLSRLPQELGVDRGIEVTIGSREHISEGVEGESKRIPDWAAYILLKGQKTFTLLGETKLSSKWESSKLPTYRASNWDTNKEVLWPLRQMAGQCVHAGTPWAIAYTPLEVVLCRFYKVSPENGKLSFGVQYQAIPLRNAGKSAELSAMLGIWSWIMFSCVDRHRHFVERSELCPLRGMFDTVTDTPITSGHGGIQNDVSRNPTMAFDGSSVANSQLRNVGVRRSTTTKVKKTRTQALPTPGVWYGRLRPRKPARVVGVKVT